MRRTIAHNGNGKWQVAYGIWDISVEWWVMGVVRGEGDYRSRSTGRRLGSRDRGGGCRGYRPEEGGDLRFQDLGLRDLRSQNLRCEDLRSRDLRFQDLKFQNLRPQDLRLGVRRKCSTARGGVKSRIRTGGGGRVWRRRGCR